MHPDDEQALGQHQAVGNLMVAFGVFGGLLAVVAGPVLQLDLGFLDALDIGLIAAATAAVGWMLRSWRPPSGP